MATPLEDVATWQPQDAPQVVAPTSPPPSAGDATRPLPLPEIGERCPSCKARVAADQRYCLECGQRRGDPRLPFMDAVTFMDATARRRPEPPAPPPPRRLRASANASLIAGIGTLVLAMGVGVLIGRSGGHAEGGATARAPVVVKVPAAGGAVGATAASPSSGKAAGAKNAGHGGGGAEKATASASANSGKGAASVLHPTAKLPPPTVHVGGSCKGGAGCKNGKFTGNFFE